MDVKFVFETGVNYLPGQVVNGTVLIDLAKEVKARTVKLIFDGKACTHWTDSESYTETDCHGHSQTRTRSVDYHASVVYVAHEIIVWSSQTSKNILPCGSHRFGFSFQLPPNCEPSFEGQYGHVRYVVGVEVDRPWRSDKNYSATFRVMPLVNLNLSPEATMPIVASCSKDTGALFFRRGVVCMTVKVPKGGFVPGEPIPILVDIDNGSSKKVTMLSAKLEQHVEYIAYREGCHHHHSVGHDHRKTKEIVCRRDVNLQVPAGSKATASVDMSTPAVPSTLSSCPLIKIFYCLVVKLRTNSTFGNEVRCERSVVIGSVPLQQAVAVGFAVPVGGFISNSTAYPGLCGHPIPSAPSFPTVPPGAPTSAFAPPPSYENSINAQPFIFNAPPAESKTPLR